MGPAHRARAEGRLTSARAPVTVRMNLGHNGGVTLVTDIGMVAISQERLNRTRCRPGRKAYLLYCLRATGVQLADVDLGAVRGIGH